jgi:hypothetical protein
MNHQPGNPETLYAEIRDRKYRKDMAAQERRYAIIAEREAARVARGEPRQPPYVPQPDDEAYRARAAYLIAESHACV